MVPIKLIGKVMIFFLLLILFSGIVIAAPITIKGKYTTTYNPSDFQGKYDIQPNRDGSLNLSFIKPENEDKSDRLIGKISGNVHVVKSHPFEIQVNDGNFFSYKYLETRKGTLKLNRYRIENDFFVIKLTENRKSKTVDINLLQSGRKPREVLMDDFSIKVKRVPGLASKVALTITYNYYRKTSEEYERSYDKKSWYGKKDYLTIREKSANISKTINKKSESFFAQSIKVHKISFDKPHSEIDVDVLSLNKNSQIGGISFGGGVNYYGKQAKLEFSHPLSSTKDSSLGNSLRVAYKTKIYGCSKSCWIMSHLNGELFYSIYDHGKELVRIRGDQNPITLRLTKNLREYKSCHSRSCLYLNGLDVRLLPRDSMTADFKGEDYFYSIGKVPNNLRSSVKVIINKGGNKLVLIPDSIKTFFKGRELMKPDSWTSFGSSFTMKINRQGMMSKLSCYHKNWYNTQKGCYLNGKSIWLCRMVLNLGRD